MVYDLEITPNRPDLNSVVGIARELSALTGAPLCLPELQTLEPPGPAGAQPPPKAENLVAVRLEDPELCPRYTARIIRGVKIAPSPDWLRSTLEKVGIRSISNVVDVTNYVMLEIGQPLHAFDCRLLAKTGPDAKPAIVVRRAAEGEKFRTLDGQERTLTSRMLLIADETKPVALAGIMGGQNSEINPGTVDVLIESAYFKPQNIRSTSRKLELRTESSYRFERGSDIGICDWASRRAAQLILQTAGGTLAQGVVDAYPHPGPGRANQAPPAQGQRTARHQSAPRRNRVLPGPAWFENRRPQTAARGRAPGGARADHLPNPDIPGRPQTRSGPDRRSRPALRRGPHPGHAAARRHRFQCLRCRP